jgi:hypothetical protein
MGYSTATLNTYRSKTPLGAQTELCLAPKAPSQNSLGYRPRNMIRSYASAEGANQRAEMNRAFSADGLLLRIPGALPQARVSTAPSAPNTYQTESLCSFTPNDTKKEIWPECLAF